MVMSLNEYFDATGDTAAAMAIRLGISAASISRIRKGEQNVSLAFARRISEETGGKVTLDDLDVPEAA